MQLDSIVGCRISIIIANLVLHGHLAISHLVEGSMTTDLRETYRLGPFGQDGPVKPLPEVTVRLGQKGTGWVFWSRARSSKESALVRKA